MIITKRRNDTSQWCVYHGSLANTQALYLNLTDAVATEPEFWNSTTPTSSVFSLGTDASVNASAGTYVAYLFAHDAGGFGLTGTDNVISCGSSVGGGSAGDVTVNLGYEPQWVLLKRTTGTTGGDWELIDNMRGWPDSSAGENYLLANSSAAEATGGYWTGHPTATGFTHYAAASATYIYIAIRRGPMKVPTTGTSVFSPNTITTTPATFNIGFPLDLIVNQPRNGAQALWGTRLQGPKQYLDSSSTAAEVTAGTAPWAFDKQNDSYANYAGTSVAWNFRRAPSFFDEVCYTGNNVSGRAITHNLAAVPQLMIVKSRTSATRDWIVYDATNGATKFMNLNNNSASSSGSVWASTAPTSTVFTVSDSASVNDPAQNYVAYLFATCAGVSKVGSYTGTGATQTIDCGFTAGARFVLIKKTSGTGSWYVWDSARGIVSGNDPYLLLNSTAAEVTNTDYIDTYSAGFEISSTAPSEINENGGSFIFLAIS